MRHTKLMITSAMALALLLAGCTKKTDASDTSALTTETSKVTVQVAVAKTGHIASYRTFGGDVVPHDTKSIIPTTSGEVKELLIEEGDFVEEGEVVARIDQSKAGMKYLPSEIKSPISGSVQSVNTQVGAQASIGSPIGTVISTDNLEIKFDVAERLLYAVRLGGKVNVFFDAYPNEVFGASIVKLSPTLNTSTRTREITLKLDEDDDRIISGMYARVNLLLSEADDAILVPSTAITNGAVFIIDGGVARKVSVETGIQSDGMVEVLSGVRPGDKVATAGISQLSDGSAVNEL